MSLSNSLGLLGRKVGMMRLFTDDGDAVPVTVVDVSNNRVTQVKTQENDGYVALQVTFGSRKAIGKGYAGTIKRHNMASQRASHGNSRSHNVPGSIGMAQDPGRVFPGKRMTGHLGDVTKTTQNLDVIRIDEARQLLLIKGAIPGSKGGFVTVRPAIKAKASKGAN